MQGDYVSRLLCFHAQYALLVELGWRRRIQPDGPRHLWSNCKTASVCSQGISVRLVWPMATLLWLLSHVVHQLAAGPWLHGCCNCM